MRWVGHLSLLSIISIHCIEVCNDLLSIILDGHANHEYNIFIAHSCSMICEVCIDRVYKRKALTMAPLILE
jgi:hypothetical protein